MDAVTVPAYAKLNLTLDVLNRRQDGYHDMRMVMQSVSLCDTLTLRFEGEGMKVRTASRFLPTDGKNLAARAALKFWETAGLQQEPLTIEIEKHIPVCAGTAGGSADAAAVLKALNARYGNPLDEVTLMAAGESIGSDVPFCLMGGTALAEGKGERLTALPPLPFCRIVMCKPGFSISTPELFGRISCGKIRCRPDTAGMMEALERGDLAGVARRMYNVFEDVLTDRQAGVIREVKGELIHRGALGAAMSGTGPTVFGLFDQKEAAEDAYQFLHSRYRDTFLVHPV